MKFIYQDLISFHIIFKDKFGIAKSTASRIINKFKSTGDFSAAKRTGRPPKFTKKDVRKVVKETLSNPGLSSQGIANEINEQFHHINKSISPEMVRNILLKHGLRSYSARKKPFLSKRMVKQRIKFCKKYRNFTDEDWKKVTFSDESYIEINLGSIFNRVRRFSHNNPFAPHLVHKTQKHPLKVMIWGCFNYSGPGNIYVCSGTMNQSKYIDVLTSDLLPSIDRFNINGTPIHLDDSARAHRGKKVMEWHQNNSIEKIEWPGNSPDLNPIENLWAILKRKLRCRQNINQSMLINNIKKIWFTEIGEESFNSLALSMRNRIKKVLENKGYSCKY